MAKRNLSKPLAPSAFDKTDPPYVTGKDRAIARRNLNTKLRAAGYTNGTSDPRAPQYKLSQDTKTGAYNYRLK